MAEKKRRCGTCRFFVKKEASGHGKCTHPKRAGTDADLLLLRPTELACRTKWGDSLWQDPEDESDPMEPKSPQQPTLPEPIAAQLQFDDEVTSVSIAGSKSSRSSFEDDVVDSGATVTGMASWNDPVQDERLNLLRKGNHDAVAGARKRHMEKQARQRELIPFADDNEAPEAEAKPEPTHEEPEVSHTTEQSGHFPPDDFVEEERSAAEDEDSFNDELVDEGLTRDRNRSPRLRKLLRNPNDPKKNEAMRAGLPSEMRVTSHNPENREQWNSVPKLSPGFELPLSKPAPPAGASSMKMTATAAPSSSTYQPRTVSQARELVSSDRLRQERAQRQMVAPLHEDGLTPSVTNQVQPVTDRPRLIEAPARDAAPLEQIRSSPLRGYHPATRKLTQQSQLEQEREPSKAPRREEAQQHIQRAPEPRYSYDGLPRQQALARPSEPQRTQQPRIERTEVRQQQPSAGRPTQHGQERNRRYIPQQHANEPFEQEPIEIAPNVPRCCGTCTSYRPSGVEGRGSCTNEFAGPVQRVVFEQDLACQHTYGSLWLPADEEVWLDELTTDYPPTPRVDAMLARRRRRETTVLPDLEELTS